jgi:hypothetical protein
VQVNVVTRRQTGLPTDQTALIVRIFLNNHPAEDRFDNMLALEPFLQSVLRHVAIDKVIARFNSLTNGFNVHQA